MPLFQRRTLTLVMSLQTIKEGYMYKRGKINTEWRQRLFVLNGKQLAYFKGSVSGCACTCLGEGGGRKGRREEGKEGGRKGGRKEGREGGREEKEG